MAKRPWFSFYAYDWLTDGQTRSMTPEQKGLYIDLLAYQWTEGGIPDSMVQERHAIARLCGVSSRKFAALWTTVRERFALGSDLVHRSTRLERERDRADKFSEKQSNRAKGRWAGDATASAPGNASDSTAQHSTAQHKEMSTADAVPFLVVQEPAVKKPKTEPLPFKPDDAVRMIAESSGGRFVASTLQKGQAIHVTGLIRKHPDAEEWRMVGRWIGGGGDGWKGTLDVRAIRDFEVWLGHAKSAPAVKHKTNFASPIDHYTAEEAGEQKL